MIYWRYRVCEVVPFWVETICISYGKYRGYIYLSKSPDLAKCPTDVGQVSNGRWPSVHRALANCPTAVGQTSNHSWPLHHMIPLPLHDTLPPQDTNTSEERKQGKQYKHSCRLRCMFNKHLRRFRCVLNNPSGYIPIVLPLLNFLALLFFLPTSFP